MKYGLVACDFDGTLLRSDNTISDYTRAVIAAYIAAGGVFMPATGRIHNSIKRRMTDIGLTANVPIASYQGAMIRENVTDKVLYYKPVANAAALEVALEAERLGLYVQTYNYDDLIISGLYDGEEDWPGIKKEPEGSIYQKMGSFSGSFGRKYAVSLGIEMTIIPGKISDYLFLNRNDPPKMLIVCPPVDMPKQLKHFTEAFPGLVVNTSEAYMMEIISPEAGKDRACDIVCVLLGIGIESCMAIGDSMNDYTMIAHAGFGIAVGNARDAVKAAAKYVTDTNNEDGAAKAIEKFCL